MPKKLSIDLSEVPESVGRVGVVGEWKRDRTVCISCSGYHDTGWHPLTFVEGTDNGSDYGPLCWCCLVTLAEKAGLIPEGKFNAGD